jgi:hypothetical protein
MLTLRLCPVKDLKVQNFRHVSSQIFDLSLKNQTTEPNQKFGGVSGRSAHSVRSEAFIGYSQCYAAFFHFSGSQGADRKMVSPKKVSYTLRTNYFFIFYIFKKSGILVLSADSCCKAGSAFICQFVNFQPFLNAFIFCRF